MRFKSIVIPLAAVAVLGLVTVACNGSDAAGSSAGPDSASLEALAAGVSDGDGATGISVSGRGVAVSEPDIASLSLGVSVIESTARQARDSAASLMTDLIDSLEDNGIAEEDFHTSQFSINPEIDYRRDGEQVIRGYRVTSTLSVTVRDLDRVGEVIDDAVDAVGDPVRVQGVTFSIDDPTALQSAARAAAMADAKAKAEELAELAGVNLGKPVSISESTSGGVPPVFFDLRAAEAGTAAETPISPGQLEITTDVQVLYVIN